MPINSKKYNFVLVAHSPDIIEYVQQVNLGEYELKTRLVNFVTAVPVARECLENGAEVILCHGGTGNSIVQEIGHSVVAIDRTDMDLIKTIRQAAKVDKNIILAAFSGEQHDLAVIEELLAVKIYHIAYDNSESLFAEVDKLYAKGIKVLVGGGASKHYMDTLGGYGFVIKPNRHSIEKALIQALALAREKRNEIARHENLLAIFKQLEEGVICVDSEKNLIFINDKAKKLLNISGQFTVQFSNSSHSIIFEKLLLLNVLADIKPRHNVFIEIANEQFIATILPVVMHQGTFGAVALFRDISSLQKLGRKIGEELHSRGFVTRYTLDDIAGTSKVVCELKSKIQRFAPTEATVLIYGETGTGKELVAHALHTNSKRKNKPFVAVNFAALPESLIESELFGYEEGAFTNAKKGGKPGLFELTNNGTLFLDEVGEISHKMQLRLLRVIEAKEVMRVGGNRYLPVDVRIISASHRFLPTLIAEKTFRLDLYYRLATLKLSVPPLRERLDDIPLLITKILQQYGKNKTVISNNILEIIKNYPWAGNVRELLAVMESYLVLLNSDKPDEKLFNEILHENIMAGAEQKEPAIFDSSLTLQENMKIAKNKIITSAIEFYNGDKKATANALGVSYTTLWRNNL